MASRTAQSAARQSVYAAGLLGVLLIAAAAAWLIARDRQVVLESAELHLDNFAVVLSEHTRLALSNDAGMRALVGEASVPLGGQDAAGSALQRYFEELYSGLDLAYEGRIFVIRRDGALLAVVPHVQDAQSRYLPPDSVLSSAFESGEAGAVRARGDVEPVERLIAYRRVRDQPLLIAVSMPVRDALAPWSRDAAVLGTGALLLVVLLSAAAWLLARELRTSAALAQSISDSEMRLNSIIASAMDAIITVDREQNVVLFNAAAEKIFGCSAAEAIGSPLDRFVPPQYRERHRDHVRRFGEAGTTTRRMGAQMVLSGLRAGGEEFPIDASISQATVGGRKFYTVILRDVTERQHALAQQRRAQRQLEDSEQRLQSIIGSAMDAIVTVDGRQDIVLFNAAAERIFGCPAGEAIGTPLDRFIPARYRGAHREHLGRFGHAGVTMRRMGGDLVLSGLRANGDEFPIDASISHVTVADEKFYTVILRDITERQRAAQAIARSHAELREMYEAMHTVREAERTRIARELHDELAQLLTALKMDAAWIAARLAPGQKDLAAKAERMKSVADQTVGAVRRLAADLRPVMLDDLGLVAALENLLHDLAERAGVVVSFAADEDDLTVPEPLATAVYRMVQEALTNVARHAEASRVDVRVRSEPGHLRVIVRDDGRGLNPDPDRRSFGVLGIRERARTLGGAARIYAPPDGGTVVEIDMPLEQDAVTAAAK